MGLLSLREVNLIWGATQCLALCLDFTQTSSLSPSNRPKR